MPQRDFINLPALPEGLTSWQQMFLSGLKENVELLVAQRGDRRNWAILRGDVETAYLNPGVGADTSGAFTAPTIDEFNALLAQFNDLLSRIK